MRTHRFYVEGMSNKWGPIELKHTVWIHDERLLHQWLHVFRFREGQDVILFNDRVERLYKITQIESKTSVHVELVTELEPRIPEQHMYLLWSLLKKDKNEWIVQKATELGVQNLVPLLADRSEKAGIDIERMRRIAIEAAEQCGRFDIPDIREPIGVEAALRAYAKLPLYIADKSGETPPVTGDTWGICIGPEGGWTDEELHLFEAYRARCVNIGPFTLRAETAAIAAVARLGR